MRPRFAGTETSDQGVGLTRIRDTMSKLLKAFERADRAWADVTERWLTARSDLDQLEEERRHARDATEAARKALLASDEPRDWSFADEEGGEFIHVIRLAPSEVAERLRAEVRGNYVEAGLEEAIEVKGCAWCEATRESVEITVTVEAQVSKSDES